MVVSRCDAALVSLLDLASTTAAEYGIPALMAESRAAGIRIAEALEASRGLHRTPSGTVVFVRPDRHGMAALERALAHAEAAFSTAAMKLDAAIFTAGDACPALAIAADVEHAIEHAMHPARPGDAHAAVTRTLLRVAARVLRTWAPNVDLNASIELLADPAARVVAFNTSVGPPRVDPTLGWPPIDATELVARAARALVASGFDDALATLAKEHDEYEVMAKRLAAAREALDVVDKLAFWTTTEQSERAQRLLAATLQEYEEAVVAAEVVLHALEQSLGEYPPLAVYVRTHAVLGAIHAGAPVPEWYVSPENGVVSARPGSWNRALVLAALVDLRRAVEAAFPGVAAIATGRVASTQARDAALPGPYRMPGVLEETDAPAVYTSEDAFFDALEAWNLRPLIARGLAHATMLGVLDHESPTLVQRVGIKVDKEWPGQEEGGHAERRVARTSWHQAVVRNVGDAACALVLHASAAEPRLVLHQRIIAAQAAVGAMAVDGSALFGRAEALAAVEAIGAHLTRHFGPGGRREALLRDIGAAMSEGFVAPPKDLVVLTYPQIVERYAEALRPRGLPGDLATLDRWMDPLWSLYPPAHAYYRLEAVFDRVAAVYASLSMSDVTLHVAYRIAGRDQALAALHEWSFGAMQVFGGLPTASEVLARYVARELR